MDTSTLIADLEANLDAFSPGSLTPDTALANHPAWDSLALLIVIAIADEQYGVSLTGDEVRAATTPRDLAARIAAKQVR